MKAAVNGVLNVSVLDGWWCEAYNGENGWAVGGGEEYSDYNLQDEIESRILYDILEKEVIPLFYDRGSDGLPRLWIKKMKESMMTIGPKFNSNRLIEDITREFYIQADINYWENTKDNFSQVKIFTEWLKNVYQYWDNIKILEVQDNIHGQYGIGDKIEVKAKVYLDKLSTNDVSVQVYFGYLDSKNRISQPQIKEMDLLQKDNQNYIFLKEITVDRVGHCGYVVRILPKYENKIIYRPYLIKWQ